MRLFEPLDTDDVLCGFIADTDGVLRRIVIDAVISAEIEMGTDALRSGKALPDHLRPERRAYRLDVQKDIRQGATPNGLPMSGAFFQYDTRCIFHAPTMYEVEPNHFDLVATIDKPSMTLTVSVQ